MQTGITQKLDQVLSIFPQAELEKQGQRVQILNALRNEKKPRKPVEIAGITGLKQPSVRRNIQMLVRAGLVKRYSNNRYSIIN